MRQEITEAAATAASHAASSAGLRPMIAGGAALMGGTAGHWVAWINDGISIALGLLGLIAVLYGFWRQREQRVEEQARAAREIEAQHMARELHELRKAHYRSLHPRDDEPGPL